MLNHIPLPPSQPTKWAGVFFVLLFSMLLYSLLISSVHDTITLATRLEMFVVGTAGLVSMGISAFSRMIGEITLINGSHRVTGALAAIAWISLSGAFAALVVVGAILSLAM